MKTPSPSPAGRRHLRGTRLRAALLASVLAAGCGLPVGAAFAEGKTATAQLSVVDPGGRAVNLLARLELPQLAAILHMSPAELNGQIEAAAKAGGGEASLGATLSAVLNSPASTVGELLELLRNGGVEPGAVQHLLESLLGPYAATSEGLQALISQILTYLESGGKIEALASELGVAAEALKEAVLAPATPEAAAGALGTSSERLSEVVRGAGAIANQLRPSTPLVVAPVPSPEGVTQLVGLPGSSGPTMTTVHSSSTSSPAGGGASNAFQIVSVKVNGAGKVIETVKVPHPGRISVTGKEVAKIARHGSTRTRRVSVRPAAASIGAGLHRITLRPRNALGNARRVTVSLVTSYTPSGGATSTKRKSVTFKRAKTKGAR